MFTYQPMTASELSSVSAMEEITIPWLDGKYSIDHVHKHLCVHSSFYDIKFLLERNGVWSADGDNYLRNKTSRCTA